VLKGRHGTPAEKAATTEASRREEELIEASAQPSYCLTTRQ